MASDGTPEPAVQGEAPQQTVPAMRQEGQAVDRPVSQAAAVPAATGLQMKPRNPFGVWLLNLITFGIYGLVYWYKIHAELAEFDRRRHINAGFELISLLLLGWTIVLPLMSIGGLAGKIRNAQQAAGLQQSCSGFGGVVLAFLFGTHVIYYQGKLNQIVRANDAAPGETVTLVN